MTLLFTDILVFLEKIPTNDHEKQRYALKPLSYSLGKNRNVFTPVIPISCINSFREMEKRGFYLVVLITEDNNAKKQQKSLTANQMLFMLTAKSGDDRAKWMFHLKSVIGMKTTANKPSIVVDPPKQPLSIGDLPQSASDASLVPTVPTPGFDTSGLDSISKTDNASPKVIGSLTDDEKLLRSKKSHFIFFSSNKIFLFL